MDRIALISDIHGNIPALQAVLKDIQQRLIKKTFCLGDLVGKGPHSGKAVDICRQECELVIKGNWDEMVGLDVSHPIITWQQQRLSKEQLDYLRKLPNTIELLMSGRKIRLFHASQTSNFQRVHQSDPEEKHLAMFSNTDFTGSNFEPDIVGYGDIHYIYLKNYREKILFNAGSVGNPLDYPQASYVILEGKYNVSDISPLAINFIRVPYDIELSIQRARDEKMPDLSQYADELRTSVYRGDKSTGKPLHGVPSGPGIIPPGLRPIRPETKGKS